LPDAKITLFGKFPATWRTLGHDPLRVEIPLHDIADKAVHLLVKAPGFYSSETVLHTVVGGAREGEQRRVSIELEPAEGRYLDVMVTALVSGEPIVGAIARRSGAWGRAPASSPRSDGRGRLHLVGDGSSYLIVKEGYLPVIVSTTNAPNRVAVKLQEGGRLPSMSIDVENAALSGGTWPGGRVYVKRLAPPLNSDAFHGLVGVTSRRQLRDLMRLLRRRRQLPEGGDSAWMTTAPRKTWSTVLPGTYLITAYQPEVGSAVTEVQVVACSPRVIRLSLKPGIALRCDVLGAPAGSKIRVTHEQLGLEGVADSRGYIPNLVPGSYKVKLATGGTTVVLGTVRITKVPAVQTFSATFQEMRKFWIRGRVALWNPKSDSMKPLADVDITVAGTHRTARTDAEGRFELSVPQPGRHRLFARHPKYRPAGVWYGAAVRLPAEAAEIQVYRMMATK